LANPASGEIHADDVIDLLIHDLALPPTIASLWVLVYTLESESELELVRETAERIFVSSDNISEFALGEVAIDRITHIRGDKSLGWDAVLPFLQLIVPHANSTRYGGGRDSDVEEFNCQLATIGDRVAQSLPIMLSLEIAVGATDRPLTSVSSRLLKALGAGTWQAYVASARLLYGSVAALRSSIAEAARHWAVVDVVPEIERTIYYLDRVEFGRIDHALSIEHQLLRSRFELNFLIENPSNWFSLRGEFEYWRQNYRRAYLEDHAQKQSHNRLLKEDIDHTNRLVTQLAMLDQVEAIRTVDESNIAELWEQIIRSFAVCENDGSLIPLVDEPLCTGCNARLGQPTNHTDIAGMISEVQHVFSGYRDRLARIVSDLVLNSPDADKLQSLFRLNSAGDLFDLANVLDDKVISFLNELFGKTSGNIDDWTSPHS
jgi:signal transduction histidine kinase